MVDRTWHQPLHGLIVTGKDDDANFNSQNLCAKNEFLVAIQ